MKFYTNEEDAARFSNCLGRAVRFRGGFRLAVAVFPFLCATQASELYRPGFGREASLDQVLLSPFSLLPKYTPPETFSRSLSGLIPSFPEVADLSTTPMSAVFKLDEASGMGVLKDNQPNSPSARLILLMLAVMMMIRCVLSERFRGIISDICSMLLAIDQSGR